MINNARPCLRIQTNRIRCVHVAALEYAADRSIWKKLWISNGMAISALKPPQRAPMFIYATVDEEGWGIVSVGNEGAIFEHEGLALLRVIRNARTLACDSCERLTARIAGGIVRKVIRLR